MVLATIGGGLVLLALVWGLIDAHLGRQRTWDRPLWTFSRSYRAGAAVLRPLLLGSGVVLIFLGSPVAGVVAVLLLLSIWGRFRWVRSARFRVALLERRLAALRRLHRGSTDPELLVRLVLETHPGWGEDLARQIAADHPDLQSLARVLARMEGELRRGG